MNKETNPNKNERAPRAAPEKGEYPHNHVFQMPGGGKFEWSDDKKWYRFVTPTGQFFQFNPDGSIDWHAVGEQKQYHKGGVTLTVDENGDLIVHGHNKICVAGGAHVEIAGDAGIAVGGDVALLGMQNLSLDVKDAYFGIRGNLGISVEGSTAISTKGETMLRSDGDIHVKSGGNVNQDGKEMYLQSGKAKGGLASSSSGGGVSV